MRQTSGIIINNDIFINSSNVIKMEKKSTKSGFGIGVIIMAVAAVIALPLGTVQFFTVLEGSSGFYAGYDWSVYLLYGLLILAFAGLFFLVFNLEWLILSVRNFLFNQLNITVYALEKYITGSKWMM